MATIFISHSSKDRAAVTEIAEQLKRRDFLSIFVDFDPENGIPPGRHWEKEFYHRLLACSAVVFVCSSASVSSKWCFAELTFGEQPETNCEDKANTEGSNRLYGCSYLKKGAQTRCSSKNKMFGCSHTTMYFEET
jgi:hypothetical protein